MLPASIHLQKALSARPPAFQLQQDSEVYMTRLRVNAHVRMSAHAYQCLYQFTFQDMLQPSLVMQPCITHDSSYPCAEANQQVRQGAFQHTMQLKIGIPDRDTLPPGMLASGSSQTPSMERWPLTRTCSAAAKSLSSVQEGWRKNALEGHSEHAIHKESCWQNPARPAFPPLKGERGAGAPDPEDHPDCPGASASRCPGAASVLLRVVCRTCARDRGANGPVERLLFKF
eukprot:1150441-Pelagomonas_calceolata.AAC.5